jgi:hypothetical protein
MTYVTLSAFDRVALPLHFILVIADATHGLCKLSCASMLSPLNSDRQLFNACLSSMLSVATNDGDPVSHQAASGFFCP